MTRLPDGTACVGHSRADYIGFRSDGFAGATIVIEPQLREQVWLGFDDYAITQVTGTARLANAPGPRCADWSAL